MEWTVSQSNILKRNRSKMASDKDKEDTLFIFLGFVDIWGPELQQGQKMLGTFLVICISRRGYPEMNQKLGREIHEDGHRGTKRGHIQLQLSIVICDLMPLCLP